MSSEEDDYMSDAFLAKLDDKRPGLITGKKAEKLMREEKIRNLVFLERRKIFVFSASELQAITLAIALQEKPEKTAR